MTQHTTTARGVWLDGSRVRDLRYLAGLTQQDLADKMGCTRQAISLIERGRRSAGSRVVGSLATALDITVSELTGIQPPASRAA